MDMVAQVNEAATIEWEIFSSKNGHRERNSSQLFYTTRIIIVWYVRWVS